VHNTKRMTPPPSFSAVFEEIRSERRISPRIARRVFDSILAGGWTPVQIGALLATLQLLAPDAAVLSAAAKAMRATMLPINHTLPLVFDTCGTGGDGHNTVNVSTGAAIIVAAAGVPVAKHGNRAATSRCGAADVLSELGIPLGLSAQDSAHVLKSVGLTFLYARAHHPAMKYAAGPRRELGVPTIFNALGPLVNPARATHQLVGTFSDELRPIMAQALATLGVERAWVVRAEDGLDEVSPFGPTRVSVLTNGKVKDGIVTPEDFGLKRSPAGAISGGDPKTNAKILTDVLEGKPQPSRDAFVLNAAASLAIARDLRLKDAAAQVVQLLDSGAAARKLTEWKRVAGGCESAAAG
jgi:anthranilate phosphoribosyltransferase